MNAETLMDESICQSKEYKNEEINISVQASFNVVRLILLTSMDDRESFHYFFKQRV